MEKCHIYKRGYQQGGAERWNIEKSTMSILRCQVRPPNYGSGGLFDYKMRNFTQITFIVTNRSS